MSSETWYPGAWFGFQWNGGSKRINGIGACRLPGGETIIKKLLLGLGIGTGLIVLVLAVLLIGLLVIKLLWAWVVDDIFPGAVEQGLIAGKISWWTSFKVALILAVLSLIWGRSGSE